MTELYLIRHLKTKGNLEGRYIGKTDEPLFKNEEQRRLLLELKKRLPHVEAVAASPMRRCMETAENLYPGIPVAQYEGWRECDFGLFENRNYAELKREPEYCQWLDSGGRMPFPQGESHEEFCMRCVEAFERAVEVLLEKEKKRAAFIVHGGTIMAILEKFDPQKRGFYHWQAENGSGFRILLEETEWRSGRKQFQEIEKV